MGTMSYCTSCGATRVAGGAFCTVCGAAQNPTGPQPPLVAPPSPATFSNVSAPATLPAVAANTGHGLRNFTIVAVILLVIFLGLGIIGAVYAVRVAKEKAEAALHRVTEAAAPAPGPGNPKNPDSPGQSR
jgi:hypothetical protein